VKKSWGPWISKGENECCESMTPDGLRAHEGHPRWIKGNEIRCSLYGDMMLITTCSWASWKVVIFEYQWKCWHWRQIWLDCEQQSEFLNLGLFYREFDHELNTRVIEYFLLFPTVTCTPRYDERFRCYDFWKLTGSLKFCSRQNWISWEFSTFDSNSNAISENLQYQHHS
jgi:hypothetical protein